MKKAQHFVLKKIQETSQQYIFLTGQLEMILPTELLGHFQVCGIKENWVKVCVATASHQTLIRFYQKNIKQKCSEIFCSRNMKVVFAISPSYEKEKPIVKPKTISEKSKKIIVSLANSEEDAELRELLLKLAK